MKTLSIFFLLFGMNILLSQDVLDQLNTLKQFSNIAFDATQLESERDARITTITTSKKGEYETNAMYKKRLADADRQAKEIRLEYDSKIKDARRQFEERQNKINNEIQQLLVSSKEETTSTFSLGSYDADQEQFPITVATTSESYKVKVPLSLAKNFKESSGKLTASGYRQLTESGSWEYFGWMVEHSGNRFAFGSDGGTTHSQYASQIVTSLIPPDLSVQIAFSEPSGDDRLDAEETAELVVTIFNKGKGTAFGVEITLSMTESQAIDFPSSSYVGEIPSGENRSKRLKLTAKENIQTGKAEVLLQFREQNGFAPDDQKITFYTETLQPPKLEIVDFGVDDFNENARIEPGETVNITARVQNLGTGTAEEVGAQVNLNSVDVFFYGNSQERFSLGTLEPGEYADFSFDLVSNNKATEMPVSLTISEYRGRFGISDYPLDLQFNQVQRRTQEMVIPGKAGSVANINLATGLSIDIEKNIPSSKTLNKNALAIIFGIEQYKNVAGVTFASRDAAVVSNYFETALGIPKKNRTYLSINDDVTKGEFDKVFSQGGWLEKRVKNDSDVYIFYAGHGAPLIDKKEAYLIPYDGDPNYPSQTGYSLDQLYENLEKLHARSVTVFLDACFSGANREDQPLLADARPIFIDIQKPSARGITVFSASSSNEISSAYPDKKHGLFTYFMLKGLQGNADINSDKKITIGELGEYIRSNVSDTAGELDREQTPDMVTDDKDRILVTY